MDYSPPGSSIHEFSRKEYWSALPFPSPGIFPTQGSNLALPHCRQTLYHLSNQEDIKSYNVVEETTEYTHRLKVREWKKVFHVNGYKKAGVTTLILDKIDFITKALMKNKEGHCIMI